jgi:hypothetical protein
MPVRDKVVSAAEAVRSSAGRQVATSAVGVGTPDAPAGPGKRFPPRRRDLGLLPAAAPATAGEGLNRSAHDGLVGRAVGGHCPRCQARQDGGRWADRGLNPKAASRSRRIAAAALSPGRHRNLVDPRQGGGKLNRSARICPGDGDRRAGVAVLPGLPGPGGDHPRHHGRPRGQHQHGARGADPGQPRNRDGGQG